jgi:hypothetical protein
MGRPDNFIMTESRREATYINANNTDEPPFDMNAAIMVCQKAGYFEYASYLARKYEHHEDYLRIQIEDLGNF